MPNPLSALPVVVSRESYRSSEVSALVSSNVSFVAALLERLFHEDEIPPNALRSYYVDYYLAQRLNGGFSQFVYNSEWSPHIARWTREGLQAIGAHRHLAHLDEAASLVAALKPSGLRRFLTSLYFGRNRDRDRLAACDDSFEELLETENLIELNAAWLRSLPDLSVLSLDEMEQEIKARAAHIPNLPERAAAALAAEPLYRKNIRALCAKSGHTLQRITVGDPTFVFQNQEIMGWHFFTDHGHFVSVETSAKAYMLSHPDKVVVVDLPLPRG